MYSARRILIALGWCSLLSMLASSVEAQLPQTRLYAIFPPGAQAGQAVDVAVANGADLDELDRMVFSHPGIQATKKSGNNFGVTVAADVPPGVYECRVHGFYGTSNPRAFVVGNLPESQENDAPNTRDQALEVKLNTVINGRSIGSADVDYFKFAGKQGQRVIVDCDALRIDSRFQGDLAIYTAAGKRLGRSVARMRRFDPFLDVTLPSDGEYILRVTDTVYAGSTDYIYRIKLHTGPHLDFVVPAVAVAGKSAKHTLYGRNLPGGQPAGISEDGRQLQKLDVQIAAPNSTDQLESGLPAHPGESMIDGFAYSFKGSNAVTLAYAPRAGISEVEPNDEPAKSQKISIPMELTGQFQVRADLDYYEFEAKAGAVYWIEVFAQRLGRLTDPYFKLERVTKNSDGTEKLQTLTTLDDDGVNVIPNLFDTLNDDVSYRFACPGDGLYRITLRDRYFEARGAPNLQYHLAVREEVPDYRLVVIPPAPLQNAAAGYQTWSVGLRRGENLHVQVAALRRHGFKGAIDLTVDGLPAGVECRGASIPQNANSAVLVFSAAEDAKVDTKHIRIVGKAMLQDASKVAAVATAEANLKKAMDALPNLEKALAATVKPLTDADAKHKAAKTKADADAAALKQATEQKNAADAQLKKATADEAAATATVTSATAAVAAGKAASSQAETTLTAAKASLDKDKENADLKSKVAAAEKNSVNAKANLDKQIAALNAANTKLAAAKKATQTATAQLKAAAAKLTSVTATSKASSQALAAATKAYNDAVAKNKAATEAKAAGIKAIADHKNAIAAAIKARDSAIKTVSHDARSATVVWNGTNQQAAVSRISKNFTVSVMEEAAPYQLKSDVFRFDISQNQQVIVPLVLTKRNGFDNKITLNAQSLPKNVKFEKKSDIDKGKSDSVARFTFPSNVAEGIYTIYLQAQGQVPYQRGLKALAAAKAEKEEAEKAQKASAEVAKKAAADAAKAATDLTNASNKLKAAQTAAATAKTKLTQAQATEKTATTAKAAADKAVADAQAKVNAAQKALDAATKALEGDKENADLKKKHADANNAKNVADAAVKAAQAKAKTAADNLAKAQATAKASAADVQVKDKAVADMTALVKAATDAKAKADAAKKTADDAAKSATTRKTNADKAFTNATNASKAKNTNWYPPSTPIVVKVSKGGYFTITSKVPSGGNLKRGQKLEIEVTVKRSQGFAGPVTVSLDMPSTIKGVTAAPITIPADQTVGKLVVTAAGDATEGPIQYLALRGTGDWNGSRIGADQAITVKVTK